MVEFLNGFANPSPKFLILAARAFHQGNGALDPLERSFNPV